MQLQDASRRLDFPDIALGLSLQGSDPLTMVAMDMQYLPATHPARSALWVGDNSYGLANNSAHNLTKLFTIALPFVPETYDDHEGKWEACLRRSMPSRRSEP